MILGTVNSTTFNGVLIDGSMGSGGALNYVGTGTLTLSGVNTYTGATLINAGGTLSAGISSAFSSGSAFTVLGQLSLNNFANTIQSLSGSGSVVTGGASGILTISNGGTFSGGITGLGGINLRGGTLQLTTATGANTYSGPTTVSNDAILQAGAVGALSAASALTLNDSANLNLLTFSNTIPSLSGVTNTTVSLGTGAVLTVAGGGIFAGQIQGTGALTASGGTLTLTNQNTFTGGTTINNGATLVLDAGLLATTGAVVVSGTFDVQQATGAVTIGNLSGAGSGVINLGSKQLIVNISAPSTYAGTIGGTGGSLTKQGASTLILSGSGSYTGPTTIATGTLQAGAINALSRNSDFTVAGTLSLNNFSNTINSLSGSGSVTTGTGTLSITNGGTYSGTIVDNGSVILNGGSLAVSGAISGTGSVVTNAGTLTLSVANSYSGGTTINAGTVALTGSGSLNAAGSVAVNGFFNISGIFPATSTQIGNLSGNGVVSLGNHQLILGTAASTTFSGVIIDGSMGSSGSLDYVGTGTLTLSGVNTYTGATLINAGGTLRAGISGAFSSASAFTVLGQLNLNNFANTVQSLSGSGSVVTGGASGILTISSGGVFSGGITGLGGINLLGGTLQLTTATGANTYSGPTTVSNDAILQAGAVNALSAASALTLNDSANLNILTFSNTIASLSGGTTSTVSLGAGAVLTVSGGGIFGGQIQGAGALTASGGTLTLTNQNTFTGGTTISNGATLALNAGLLATTGSVVVNGTFDIQQATGSVTIGNLSGAATGAITLGSKQLIVNISAPSTYAGTIGGTGGSLTKQGASTLTLSGSGSYTGLTTIAAGTLQAGAINAFSPNSAFNVTTTLDLNGFSNTIDRLIGTGTVTSSSGNATLTLNNGSTFAGSITGNPHTLGLVLNNGTLTLTSPTNTYTGSTTINNAGMLQAGGMNVLSAASNLILQNTAQLNLQTYSNTIASLQGASGTSVSGIGSTLTITNGSNGGNFSGEMVGSLALNLTGGTLVLNPTLPVANTYSGTTTVGLGSILRAGATNAFSANSATTVTGILSLNNFANTILSLAGAGSVTTGGASGILTVSTGGSFSGGITGAGGLTLSSGTLVLSGSTLNTYTGPTTIATGATLQAGAANSFSPLSNVTVTGTLSLANLANTIEGLFGAGAVTTGGVTGILTVANGGTFSGGITGAGGLTLTGGTLNLTTSTFANTYSGITTISNNGILIAGAIDALSPNSPFVLNNSATLNLNGYNNTLYSLASASAATTVILGSSILTINGGATTTFAGQITNLPCGGLTIDGGTNLTLTNPNNNYCGATSIVDGTLQIQGSGALAPLTNVNVSSLGILTLGAFTNSAQSVTTSGIVTNSGNMSTNALSVTGGIMTNNPSATFYGLAPNPVFSISGGTLVNNNLFGSNSASAANAPTLTFSGGTIDNNYQIYANSYTQDAGATLNLQFKTGGMGQIFTQNNINLNGALDVTAVASFPTSGGYVLLSTAAGTVVGTFSSFTPIGFGASDPRLVYSVQNVSLFFSTCAATWIHPGNQNWGNGANWTPSCVPGANGNESDTATFNNIIGQSAIQVLLADPSGTIALPLTLFQLNFNASTTQYTIEQFSNASTITFDANFAGTPQINVFQGSPIINAPLILNKNTELVLADGAQLTFGTDTTLTSTAAQNFAIVQSNTSVLGSGLLINNTVLTPYSLSILSGSVQNNDAMTPTNFMDISALGGQNATVTNAKLINPAGTLTIGGAGSTTVTNSGITAFIGSTGSNVIVGGSGTTVVSNSGTQAQFGPTGAGGNITIGSSGTTTVTNNGEVSSLGAYGTGGDFIVTGAGSTTIINSGLNVKMGAFGMGGNVSVGSGNITNSSGALFYAGSGGEFSITGGTITNDLSSTVGSTTANMVFSGGTLITSGDVLAFDYTQSAPATLQLNLAALPTTFGNVAASGSAVVGGTLVLDVLPNSGIAYGQVINLVTAQRGLLGTYATVDYLNFPTGVIPTVVYTSDAVQLAVAQTVTPNSIGSFSQIPFISVNEGNIMTMRQLFQLHKRIMDKKRHRANQGSYEQTTALGISTDSMIASTDLSFIFFGHGKEAEGEGKTKERKQEEKLVDGKESLVNSSRFYIGPTSSLGDFESRGTSQTGFNYDSVGIVAGFDHAFEDVGLGLSGNYQDLSAHLHHHAGRFIVDQLHGNAYLAWTPSSLPECAVDAIVGFGYDWYDIHRKAGSPVTPVTAKGKTHGLEADALLGAEYIFSKEQMHAIPQNMLVTPFLNVQYIWADIENYKERDAGIYGLHVREQHANSLRSTLGIRWDYLVKNKNFVFQPEFSLAWQYEYLDSSRSAYFSTLQAPNFQTIGSGIVGAGRNTLLTGVDFLFTIYRVFELELSYDLQWNNLYTNNAFYVGIGGNF